MKIIDLLNKIANNEEIPEKIKWNNFVWHLEKLEEDDYFKIREDGMMDWLFGDYLHSSLISVLNDEVEVIEDNKKIEKLVMDYAYDIEEKIFYEKGDKPNHCIVGDAGTELLIGKINEIIEVINNGTMD